MTASQGHINVASRTKRRTPYDPNRPHDRRAKESNKGVQNFLQPIEVDDPLEVGGKLIVMRNTRNDPLARLHSHHQIDDAQYHGGRAFQKDFETAERGPQAMDPGKEYVDGGLPAEPITEGQRKAVIRLTRIERALGLNGSALIHAVLIQGLNMEQVGSSRGLKTEAELKYLGRRFREGLETLAVEYNLAQRK